VESPSLEQTGFIDVSKLMSLSTWNKHRGLASEKLESLDGFQSEMKKRVDKAFDINIKKLGVVYASE
jgi:hypothetical protein